MDEVVEGRDVGVVERWLKRPLLCGSAQGARPARKLGLDDLNGDIAIEVDVHAPGHAPPFHPRRSSRRSGSSWRSLR